MIKMYVGFHVMYPLLNFLDRFLQNTRVIRRHKVTQLVEALRYKPEDRRFDSRWCHWNFSLT